MTEVGWSSRSLEQRRSGSETSRLEESELRLLKIVKNHPVTSGWQNKHEPWAENSQGMKAMCKWPQPWGLVIEFSQASQLKAFTAYGGLCSKKSCRGKEDTNTHPSPGWSGWETDKPPAEKAAGEKQCSPWDRKNKMDSRHSEKDLKIMEM